VQKGDSPAPPQQSRDADDNHHRHRDPRAKLADHTSAEAEPIATVNRPIMVDQQKMDLPENE
jgi:hypothetical protein